MRGEKGGGGTGIWDIVGLVPDHHSKASCNPFAGRGSRLRFVKNATSVRPNKVKHNKTRYACMYETTLAINC